MEKGMSGQKICQTIAGIAILGALGAANGALSGSIGSAVMRSSNHTGYDVVEATRMGAVGGSLFLSIVGGVFFYYDKKNYEEDNSILAGLAANVVNCLLSGLIGYALLHEASPIVAMELRETAIAFTVGAAVWGGSTLAVGVLLAICCGVIACGASMANANTDRTFFFNRPSEDYPHYGTLESISIRRV